MEEKKKYFSSSDKKVYEEYVVIFIDILGFGDAVRKSKSNEEEQKRLIEFFVELKKMISKCFSEKFPDARGTRIKSGTMLFSDSIVHIFPVSLLAGISISPNQYAYDLTEKMQSKALMNGFLTRGAITIGEAYYDHPVCFGPAVIEAIKLEKEEALFPRVIVSKRFLTCFDLEEVIEKENWKSICKDDDGKYYVNYLENLPLRLGTEEEARKIKKQINDAADKSSKECVINKVCIQKKIEWFNMYFEASIKKNRIYLKWLEEKK